MVVNGDPTTANGMELDIIAAVATGGIIILAVSLDRLRQRKSA